MKQSLKFLCVFISSLIILFISTACKISTEAPSPNSEYSSTANDPSTSSTNSNQTSSGSTDPTDTPVTKEIFYTIEYESEHGTLPDSIKNGISVKENTTLIPENLPTLSAEGYAFGGWYDGETLVVAGEYKVTKETTLTAKWTIATVLYTISFVSDYGTTPESITLPKNTILMEDNVPTLFEEGYRFDGWYDGENKIEVGSYRIEKNIELTAKWTACWIIHFDPNGGTGTMADQLMDGDGKPHPLNKNSFVREGYTFIGWTTSYNVQYGTLEYGDEANLNFYSIDEPVEGPFLYALWEPITYTVRFDTNRGVYEDIQVTYDESHTYNYKCTEISLNGVYISSWNTKPDGTGIGFTTESGVLWKNVNFTDISTENGAVISLYAQWETSSYNIRINGGGGKTQNGETEIYVNLKYGESYTLENPFYKDSRSYVKEWRCTKSDDLNYHETFENNCTLINLSGNHGAYFTITPVWNSTSYRIHFDGNGGTGRDWYEITGYYDEEVTMPENVYTRSGYTFICWEGGYPVGSKAINLGKPGDLIYVKAIWAKTNATSDFTLTIDAPAENAPTIIERLPGYGIYTLNLSGECNEETIIQIGTKLKEKSTNLELHLEDTEGLTRISGLSECSSLNKIYLPTETRIGVNALYGCTRLQGVYFPNYISNSFSIKGENETNSFIRLIGGYRTSLISNFRDEYPYYLGSIAEALAKVLANNGDNELTAFEGYKYEWRVE